MPATDPPLPAFAAPGRLVPSARGTARWQRATVLEVRRETHRATTFRLALEHWTEHAAGQHYMLRLTAADGYRAQRDYSVASPPEDRGVIELTVDRLDGGEVSTYLHDVVGVGDVLEVRGPAGGFFAWTGERPALLVGGGSGVVPLMCMVRHHRRRALDVPLRMVLSVRGPDDAIYATEYGPETTVVYTRAAPPGWPYPVGRIGTEVLAPLAERAATEGWEAYVCGPDGFAEHAGRLLARLGVPRERIRIERFG